ncbi:MAG: response regulator [Gammaproteobacteria bacterium]|nr:response regulator [Gammaproteobacteria bacterium]
MLDDKVAIMLVDDDEVDAMNVQRAFSLHKINNPLYIAGNGVDALAMLRGKHETKLSPMPKIILLDINMPKMNGIEFLRELRADPALRALCVVILTTSDEDRDRQAAYELNVSGYVLKPIEPEKFNEAIHTLYQFWSLIRLP